MKKTRKLGLKFGTIAYDETACAVDVLRSRAVAVIDAETGEEIGNVCKITTEHEVAGVITATVTFFVTRQDGVPNDPATSE